MKQILVLQNQRIGDTLQTTPLLAGLRESHRPCHITLVANNLFASLKLGPLVDEVIYFDQNALHETFTSPALSLAGKYNRAREFLEPLRARRFDLVVDVPADTCMHLLASSLENAREIRGVVLGPSRTWRYTSREVMLLYTIGLCREVNRFNLVDLQNLLAGVRAPERRLLLPVSDADTQHARSLLAEWGLDAGRDTIVALNPGASEERKRWGSSNFGRLAALLTERLGAHVILCGSEPERAMGEEISRLAGGGVHQSMGRADITQLAALLRLSRVLVTNDTGPLHVAAAAGTPVIDLSTGPVNFRETGPYAEGALVLEGDIECSPCNFNAACHHYACRERIRPEMVARLVEAVLREEPLDRLPETEFRGARLYRAAFNDVGRLDFLPVFRLPLNHYQFLSYFYAHTWEVFYGLRHKARETAEILGDISRLHDLAGSEGSLVPDLLQDLADLDEISAAMRSGIDLLAPLVVSSRSTPKADEVLQRLGRLEEIQKRILFHGRTRPAVRHFTAFLEMAVVSAAAEPVTAVRSVHDSLRFLADQTAFLTGQLREAVQLIRAQSRGGASAVA